MATTKPRSRSARQSAYRPVQAVEVRAWGKLVGAVALEPTKNYYAFIYDPSWVKRGIELAPLQMPLAQASEPFLFTDLPEETYKRLPALLADALPDDFGNALIDAWMAERGLSKGMVSALDRLAYMGKRGMIADLDVDAIGGAASDDRVARPGGSRVHVGAEVEELLQTRTLRVTVK